MANSQLDIDEELDKVFNTVAIQAINFWILNGNKDIKNVDKIEGVSWPGSAQSIRPLMLSILEEIIGEDEKFTNIQMVDGSGKPTSKLYDEAFSLHQVTRNQLRAELRQSAIDKLKERLQ